MMIYLDLAKFFYFVICIVKTTKHMSRVLNCATMITKIPHDVESICLGHSCMTLLFSSLKLYLKSSAFVLKIFITKSHSASYLCVLSES